MKFILILLLGSIGFSAQANSLTPLQKQLALSTLRSYTLASVEARTIDPANSPAGNPPSGGLTPFFYQMLTQLQAAIRAGDCTIAPGSVTSSTGSCPIIYSQGPSSADYTAIVTSYQNLTDIIAFSTASTWDISTHTISGFGSMTSQTLGTLNITITGSWAGDGLSIQNTTINYTITFPAFTVQFSVMQFVNSTGVSVFSYLNGAQLTPAESDYALLPAYQPQPKTPPPPQLRRPPYF